MEEHVWYLNGEFVSASEARIPFTDRGIRWGDGVFETERTFDGEPFRLRDHIRRLFRSLKFVRIDPGLTPHEIEEITREVLRRNAHLRGPGEDFWITQTITRGSGWTTADKVPPTVCVRTYPLEFQHHARYYETGCRIVFSRSRSYPVGALDPKVKHISRMNFVLAELEAQDVDPGSYAVLLDEHGNITEYAAGNFFVVTDGVLRTPRVDHLLPGITRSTTIELARELGIAVVEEDLQPYDAYSADEAFLTTTSFCVLPISHIDKRPLERELPGTQTARLLAAWNELAGLDIAAQAMNSLSSAGQNVVSR